jgi:hypothetical protein
MRSDDQISNRGRDELDGEDCKAVARTRATAPGSDAEAVRARVPSGAAVRPTPRPQDGVGNGKARPSCVAREPRRLIVFKQCLHKVGRDHRERARL